MTITFDEDLILPILTSIFVTIFLICYQTLVPRSSVDYFMTENDILFHELSQANREIDTLTKEVDKYHLSQASLESLGASPIDARRAMMAAEVHCLDPKPMEHL